MGKVAAVKRGRVGRSRSKGQDSDDSDEDYMVEEDEDYIDEEDEDELLSDEEDENEDEREQNANLVSDHDNGFKEETEEEDFCVTAQLRRKRSGLPRMNLGSAISNIQRNALRRYVESDNENETQTERLQAAEEEEEDVNEITILKRKRSCLDQRKVRCKVSSNRRNAHEQFDDDDYNVEEDGDDDAEEDQTHNLGVSEEEQEIDESTRSNLSRRCSDQMKLHTKTSDSRRNQHGKVDDEDYNFDDEEEEEEDDDEDDEFMLDESFSLEEEYDEDEEEHVVKKKKKNSKQIKKTSRKKSYGSRIRKKRRANVASKVGKKRKESRSVRRNVGSDEENDGDDCEDEDFTNINFVEKRRTKKKPRRGNFTVLSDSDCVDSGPSDIEFTISEEEREQIREASNICRKSTVPLSSCTNTDRESFDQRRKCLVAKGKEKIPELKIDIVKHVCGICFSEEGKNTVRGELNSCSHYFCFACILEWSKVESRCPLCKQRFQTITKSVKANTGVDSKDVVLPIPERDQVYQPTEEEIRGYFDPYENVICTECREGGDDELMLLCDLCDSPAHTYCVGLGRDVPEGNWYCEGCRPASLAPSNNQIQDSVTGQRNLFHRLSSFEGIRDDFDGSFPTPSTSFPQGFGSFPSPLYLGGGIQSSSPRSGAGVVTVSGRRQIHRQIQFIFSNNRSRQATNALIGNTVDSPRVSQSHSCERTSSPVRTPVIGISVSTQLDEESCNTPTPQSMQFLPVSSHQLADQLVLDTNQILDEINVQGASGPSNTSTSHNVQPFIVNNNINAGCDYHPFSSTFRDGSNFYLEQQVKHLVQNYLESMSRTLALGESSVLEDIERKSRNTILAACGHHHHPSEVFPMRPQSRCSHNENSLIPASPIKDQCISCFNTFTKEVVRAILNSKLPHFLHVRE